MIPPGIFFECCTRLNSKFDLSRPFHREGWLYATDGRILVRSRIDPREVGTLNAGRKLPNPISMIASVDGHEGRSVPLPDVTEFVPCQGCEGQGDPRCPHCGGNGRYPALAGVRIHDDPDVALACHYVAMLRRHAVEAVDIHATADEVHPVTFRGPDFEGWLMTMTRVSIPDDDDADEDADEDDELGEVVDVALNAGEAFKQHMLVATMREEWRAEVDRLDSIMARVDELLKSAPNRGLCNLLETMRQKCLLMASDLDKRNVRLYDALGGDVAYFNEDDDEDDEDEV
jgi:hypothetical protein